MAVDQQPQTQATRTVTTETVPVETQESAGPSPRADHGMTVAERVVWLVFGVIIGLLALRFVLRLLGANPANGFADFIYTVSNPLASPFFGLFSYDVNLAQGRFEFETLVAILVYALVAWLIAKIVTIGRRG